MPQIKKYENSKKKKKEEMKKIVYHACPFAFCEMIKIFFQKYVPPVMLIYQEPKFPCNVVLFLK